VRGRALTHCGEHLIRITSEDCSSRLGRGSPGAPGHPHLCGMVPLMPRCDRVVLRACPAPSPQRGVDSLMRVLPPPPFPEGNSGTRAGGKDVRLAC
jgi:hypothetical protein